MTISVKELKEKIESATPPVIIDVREPYEYDDFRITDFLLPMGDIMDKMEELEKYREGELIVYCNTGKRSIVVADLLASMGFSRVSYLEGGLEAWKESLL